MAAKHTSGTRNIQGLAGMLQSCSLCQDRKNLLRCSRNSTCSANLESESRGFRSCCLESSQFSIVWLYLFLRGRYLVIPQCLGNLLRDFHEKISFSYLTLHINGSSLFEPDRPTDSPDRAPIFEIHVLDWFHEGQYQNSSVPTNFFCPFLPQPQMVFSELRILLDLPVQLSFQGRHGKFSF